MVSYSKSSFIIFLSSSIGGANGHKPTPNFDAKKFKEELRELRRSGPGSEIYAAKMMQKGSEASEAGMLRVLSEETQRPSDLPRRRNGSKQKGKNRGGGAKGKNGNNGGAKGKKGNNGGAKGKSGNDGNDGGVTSEYGSIVPGCTSSNECFLDGHEFRGPRDANDVRAPCPFINCMANHGFINRNGKDVPAFNIPQLATILFDIPVSDFDPVVNLAIFDGQAVKNENGEVLLDIDRLWDRPGEERDLSQIFPNPGLKFTRANFDIPSGGVFPVGGDEQFLDFRYTISEEQLQDLLSRTTEDGFLTIPIHTEFLIDRLEDSLNAVDKDAAPGTDPHLAASFFRFSEEDTHVTSNQFVFPTLLMNEHDLDYTFIPAGHIETFWREFRFPEGFAPHSVRFGMDGNYDVECFLAERERLQTNNEWTLKKRLMQDSMLKAGVTEETIIQALKEVDRPNNERIPKIFRENPDRAAQCAPLPASEGMAPPKDIDTAPPQVTAQWTK